MASSPDLSLPASTRMNLRPEPLVRPAVPRAAHPPAYVAKLRKAWRVVVPVRGRLSPRLIAREFPTQSAALRWLASEDGQRAVAQERSGPGHRAERGDPPERPEDPSCS
jgi:hypothetical protein